MTLYINNNQEVILEVTTSDGYPLVPNYDHSAYVCYGLLVFPELIFVNDFKQCHYGDEEDLLTVTKTIPLAQYWQSRIPKVFSWNNEVYSLGEGINVVNEHQIYFDSSCHREILLSPKFILNHAFQIEVQCWTCPNAIEHPAIKNEYESEIIQNYFTLP